MDRDWKDELSRLRSEIDRIDSEIIKLLDKRFDIVREICKIKLRNNIGIIDKSRGREIIRRAGKYREIFEKIIEESVETQWEKFIDSHMKQNSLKDTEIGIVGYGKMGQLFTKLFKKYFKVNIYDIKKTLISSESNVIYRETLRELVHASHYVMIATSLNTVDKVAAKIRKIIVGDDLEDKIVFDIATLKYRVIKELSKYPPHIKVSSIHPMFGGRIKHPWNHKILIIPLKNREKDAHYVEELFKPFGFTILYVQPEEHDKHVAYTIALPYILGLIFSRVVKHMNREKLNKFGGTSYNIFSNYVSNIIHEDKPEFIYKLLMNQYSRELLNNLYKIIRNMDKDLPNFLSQCF